MTRAEQVEQVVVNEKLIALRFLAKLTPDQWDRLNVLRERHKAGLLSFDAWVCSTAAALENRPGRVPERISA